MGRTVKRTQKRVNAGRARPPATCMHLCMLAGTLGVLSVAITREDAALLASAAGRARGCAAFRRVVLAGRGIR